MIAVSARRLFECRPNAPCKSRPYVSALAFFHLGRAARRALCYALDMERLRFFVLVAAILTAVRQLFSVATAITRAATVVVPAAFLFAHFLSLQPSLSLCVVNFWPL